MFADAAALNSDPNLMALLRRSREAWMFVGNPVFAQVVERLPCRHFVAEWRTTRTIAR